jgi:ectoine hydroxylase-related dioxygenase (phytanoyl-CoA dioxygenase family)
MTTLEAVQDAVASFDPVAFHRHHRFHGPLAAADAHRLGPITFVLESGTWTYVPTADDVQVVEGPVDGATVVVEMDDATFAGLALDVDTPVSMIIQSRVRVVHGKPMRFSRWEPPLRALFHGRPVYDPDRVHLLERDGSPLDPGALLALHHALDDPGAIAHRIEHVGFAVVGGVFSADEVAELLAEADTLRAEARRDDLRSWWGTTADGETVVTRVLDAVKMPKLGALYEDPRITALVAATGLDLKSHADREIDGVAVLWKIPQVTQGLADLPWHRDCGMGGHAVNCPCIVVSICLTDGSAAAGELRALPGSHHTGFPFVDGTDVAAPDGVGFAVGAGDVSLHDGDVMHVSLEPTSLDGPHRVSVLLAYSQPHGGNHLGDRHYNDAVFSGDGAIRVREVTDRA